MQVLFMDAHVLVTKCCSYHCIPEWFHLHLLHCIHCIASVQGEFQLQGELLVFFDLMCACANKGENFGRSDRTRGRLVWFLKNLLCTGLWECIILGELHVWEEKALLGEFLLCFWLLVFLAFLPLPAWLRRALPLSLRSHVLAFDRLRRAVVLVLGDRSVLE